MNMLRLTPPSRPTRKPSAHGKFYFFDVGVANALAGRKSVERGTEAYGKAMENVIYSEISAFARYAGDGREVSFWRTADGTEVDFVLGDDIAIEVKATTRLSRTDLRGLRRIGEEHSFRHRLVACLEDAARIEDGILVLPVTEFLSRLWAGELTSS